MEETKFRPKTEEEVLLESTISGAEKKEQEAQQKEAVESSMEEVVKEKEQEKAGSVINKAAEEVLRGQIEDIFKEAEVQNKSEKEAVARKKTSGSISWENLANEQKKEEEEKKKESWF
ncbi:MAG: hypothetical protein G01um10143_294 [Parcubacteria group bacterium Gr01-1014_3]|nr:MAG: hypothetical protein G01um10143_294 [Parcubacteria group bacterium Gr01-1014_3]